MKKLNLLMASVFFILPTALLYMLSFKINDINKSLPVFLVLFIMVTAAYAFSGVFIYAYFQHVNDDVVKQRKEIEQKTTFAFVERLYYEYNGDLVRIMDKYYSRYEVNETNDYILSVALDAIGSHNKQLVE